MNTAMQSPGRALAHRVAAMTAQAGPEDLADPEVRELIHLAASALKEETPTASREAMLARLGPTPRAIFSKWLRKGDDGITAEEWANIRATMSTTTGSEGGFTVPAAVADNVVDALKLVSPMFAAADVFITDSGANLSWPTSDGTTEVGERLAQNATATGLDVVFGQAPMNTARYSSKQITAPVELVLDAEFDVFGEFLNQRIADRIGRSANADLSIGTGTTMPDGIVPKATAGKVGAASQGTGVIYDDIVDLVHSVDALYRQRPGSGFMMHDTILKTIRRLKDSAGAALIQTGQFDDTAPHGRIMGYPIYVNNDMATPALNSKSLIFGNLKYYKVRVLPQLAMFRFTDSALMKLGQIGYLAFARIGGNLTDVNAVKYFQCAAS